MDTHFVEGFFIKCAEEGLSYYQAAALFSQVGDVPLVKESGVGSTLLSLLGESARKGANGYKMMSSPRAVTEKALRLQRPVGAAAGGRVLDKTRQVAGNTLNWGSKGVLAGTAAHTGWGLGQKALTPISSQLAESGVGTGGVPAGVKSYLDNTPIQVGYDLTQGESVFPDSVVEKGKALAGRLAKPLLADYIDKQYKEHPGYQGFMDILRSFSPMGALTTLGKRLFADPLKAEDVPSILADGK